MKLTSLLIIVGRLQPVGKIDNLQQACGIFGFVTEINTSEKSARKKYQKRIKEIKRTITKLNE